MHVATPTKDTIKMAHVSMRRKYGGFGESVANQKKKNF